MNKFLKIGLFCATIAVCVLFIVSMAPYSLGTNCWSGGENRGYKDGMDMTGPAGATKRCEAKLHVCFKGGSGDPAIPCTVDTYMKCSVACSSVESNVACTPEVCLSRCLAARVPGSVDVCD